MNIYELLQEIIVVRRYMIDYDAFAEDEKSKLDSEEDKKLFELLKNISFLGVEFTDKDISFHPIMVGEGTRTFSLEDISEDDYAALMSLDFDKIPLNLRARVTDLLWTQKKEYKAALAAAESYLELFRLWYFDKRWVNTLDMIKRAICISAQINNREIYEESCQTIYNEVMRLAGDDTGFLSLRLLDILLEQDYGEINELLAVVNSIIAKHKKNVSKVERAYEIKNLGLKKLKKKDEIKDNQLELAEYYVSYAEEILGEHMQGAMQAERFYRKAIEIYRNNGESTKGEQILRRLVEVQKEIPKQMMPITMEFDVSGVKAIIDLNMEGLTFEESVVRLTQIVSFPPKEAVKKRLYEDYRESPLSYLFGKNLVNAYGQTVLALKPLNYEDPESDPELLDMHLHQKMLEEQMIAGDIQLKFAFLYISNNYDFELSDLDFLICNNPIIPRGREQIFRSAVYMVLKGQYYEAMHILAPQVENLFRNIAKEVGGLTVTLDHDGTSKEKVLSSVFDLPELLDCYDNDILFIFKGLLNERAGANIRNLIAHGMVSEAAANSGIYLYFAGAVIKLLSYTSIRCYELIKGNPKLKTFISSGKDAIKIKRMK